ncbi:hypothetical protein [Ruminococcus albus]|uniref:Uncharacterized protein n=1 Tax=Ruminococcus albus TaxID=1264 RepID=A0A1I1DY67_RUMAL|nr:hypothetical protein [Ruminococcus albus]SFB79747.1 hypothetical protein SAMN02910406_00567 [Ruminococcus albus]
MKNMVKDKLINDYNDLSYHTDDTFTKYRFTYNGVYVHVYFDAYDYQALSLSVILIYERDYYYTSLNVDDTDTNIEYLHKIPLGILRRILVNKKLDDMFEHLEEHILNSTPEEGRYSDDKLFSSTLKFSGKRKDLPFWKSIKHVRMSDDTLNRLRVTSNISLSTLKKIQSKNMTLVKTQFPKDRKNIKMILDSKGIDLELRS